ncbi:MAG TPA: hypothetical protein VIN08_25285, partial [Ohtaekwangia sp.]|uniref:hypothetical protein n=1 Tax=Ohtaekwangia sp. TaxID=2066019 RepID=UPI002F940991
MFTRKLFIKILAAVMVIAVACNVLKKEEPDQDIIMFLNGFQSSLSKSDEVILGYFDAHQSKESILSAIRILQNKEHEFIACSVGFADAAISREEAGIRVTMPAHFASQNIDGDFQESATITFWLKPKKKSFVITKLEGEEFYNAFTSIRGEMEWKVETAREFKKREAIYTQAKTLQQQYDSVIWYTTYDQKNYFYVIKGTWNIGEWSTTLKTKPGNYTMGLVSEQGASIIPAAYDLIGTIGFDVPGLVEIKKNGKVGYFNLETQQQIVEPLYDMIIPYTADNSFA